MPVVIEKTRVNAFNAGGFLVMVFVAGGTWWATQNGVETAQREVKATQAAVQEIRDNQVLRAQITDRNNQDTKAALQAVPKLEFSQNQQAQEIADLKKSIEATNIKVDRFMELLNAKLDTIGENINGLRVDVRVLGAAERRADAETKRSSRQ